MEKCLYCYKPLKPGQVDYHPACARKLFGTKEAPVLPYVRKEIGDPENGIEPGTSFEDLPEDWVCPLCGVGKEEFEKAS